MRVNRSKHFRLSGKSISSLDDFYTKISQEMKFPAYFGCNLDALWDVLTTDIKGPVILLWEDSAVSKEAMEKTLKEFPLC